MLMDYNAKLQQKGERTMSLLLREYSLISEAMIEKDGSLLDLLMSVDNVLKNSELTDRQWLCIKKHYILGIPQLEIARRLNVSQPTINEHIREGLRKISKQAFKEGFLGELYRSYGIY